MTPSYWVSQGLYCLYLGLLFYTLVLGGWLNQRWKERHPGWRARLPGDHRAPTMGAPRLRNDPLVAWGTKVTPGTVEILEEET